MTRTTTAARRRACAAALLPLGLAAGCSGDPSTMPTVEGLRLDVAMADLDAAGVGEDDVDVLGGGMFGVVDESNWMVCAQQPSSGDTVEGSVRVTVDRSCDEDDDLEPDEGQGEARRSGRTRESASPAGGSEGGSAGGRRDGGDAAQSFVMPDLVGAGLQDAQDLLQSMGSYLLSQDDALGLGRFQILDADWRVCSQRPRAGARADAATFVDLDVVKLDESCP